VQSKEVSQGSRQCDKSYATQGEIAQVGQKVAVKVIVHDFDDRNVAKWSGWLAFKT